jgi:hypothetical protein
MAQTRRKRMQNERALTTQSAVLIRCPSKEGCYKQMAALAAKKSNIATTPFILIHCPFKLTPLTVNDVSEHLLTIFPVSIGTDLPTSPG